MKRILGLDLGVASIGWAIIDEDEHKQELIRSGVRIIPIESDTANNFSKGISTSKNADRRTKRSARRNIQRYRLRKHFLIKFLAENKIWPLPEKLFNLNALELYGLRHHALHKQIELHELARIWFHLNQKRGYIDSRKGTSEDEKNTQYVEAIKSRSAQLYANYKTVGSYFYHKLINDPLYRIKSGNAKENIFLADDYKLEFDLIWNAQKEFYPELLTDYNYELLRNRIIYYKRKLKSQKHLIGECRFEKQHKCMPVSSPVAEEIRLWQDINKLVITNQYNEVFLPTKEQKQDLFKYLMDNESISTKDVLKRLNYPYSSKEGYTINFEKYIKGYVFRAKLIKTFSENNTDLTSFLDYDNMKEGFSKHPFFELWHLLYSIDDPKILKNTLTEKFGEVADKLMKLPIKNDFAALSSRAARKLLPHLREGEMYAEACKKAGYNHSDYISKEENEKRTIISTDKLELIKPNELRNPTVEKILNQLINLLKQLTEEYGRPDKATNFKQFDEIRIELARDLKKNAKERQKISRGNREKEEENRQIFEKIKEHIAKPSKRDIEKYKLWAEFGGCSPYEPNKRIELHELFDKAKYEIEHIIPKSRLFDDSFNNRTIARVHINKEKNNQTAHDYMMGKGNDAFYQYSECIKSTKLSKTKRAYFLTEGSNIPENFINRQLNETRYITSKTLSLLKAVCRNVYSTSGSVTDYLRHHWGYNDVLMDLNFDRTEPESIDFKEINGTKRKVIRNWSKRADNRHHALDAIVIACTKESHIYQLNNLNKKYTLQQDLKETAIKSRIPFNYETVKSSLEHILISYKAGKKIATIKTIKKDRWNKEPGNFGQKTLVPRGALHEESVYGYNKSYKIIEIKKLDHIEKCAVLWQKEAIENHLSQHNVDLISALRNLKKKPIIYDGDKCLEHISVFVSLPVKRYELQYSQTNKFDLKTAKSIVNENVKRKVIARLKEHDEDPAKAFKNLEENPLYFNREKGIKITSVRCYTKDEETIKSYPALHESKNGRTLNHRLAKGVIDKKPVDFVIEGNNHHISVFADQQGNRYEITTTFFEAFQRKVQGFDPIVRSHPEGYRFLFSIQQNEMFVFGMNKEQLQDAVDKENYQIISKYLYRVLNIAPKQYMFLHHLETKIPSRTEEKQRAKRLKLLIQCSASSVCDLKVKITRTGKIELMR